MKIPESVLVVIYTPALDVLLIERADHPGFWQSVTGSRNAADEPLRATCVREVAEETGLRRVCRSVRRLETQPLFRDLSELASSLCVRRYA